MTSASVYGSYGDYVKDMNDVMNLGFDFDVVDPASSQHGPPAHDTAGPAAQARIATVYPEPVSESSDSHSDEELKPLPPPPAPVPKTVTLPVPPTAEPNSWYPDNVFERTKHHAPLLAPDSGVMELIRACFASVDNALKNTLQPPPATRKKRPPPVPAPEPDPEPDPAMSEPAAKKPKKTRKPAQPAAPVLSPEVVALEWLGKLAPPPFRYADAPKPIYLLFTHASTAIMLWLLRAANVDNQLVKTMVDHDERLIAAVRNGDMVRRIVSTGGQDRVLTEQEAEDPEARLIAAGLMTAYKFLQLFVLVRDSLPDLEATPIWMAEAVHGPNDEIAVLKDEYRMWIKEPGTAWTMKDTVAAARHTVGNYKIAQAARTRKPPVPTKPAVNKRSSDNDLFGGFDDDEAAPAEKMEPDEEEEPPAAPEITDLPVPPMEKMLVPTDDEFSAQRFCDVTMKHVGERPLKWLLEHADTLFSVRQRPSKSALMVLLHKWHEHIVETEGRVKTQNDAVIAVFNHRFAHFLLGLTLLLDAARPTPVPPRPYYAFDLCELNVYKH